MLGLQRLRASWVTTTHHQLECAGGGGHRRALAGKTVTAISAAYYHSCAVADGQAFCWGNNAYGQLGNNTTTNSSVPVAVTTGGVLAGQTVTAIAAGANIRRCWRQPPPQPPAAVTGAPQQRTGVSGLERARR